MLEITIGGESVDVSTSLSTVSRLFRHLECNGTEQRLDSNGEPRKLSGR
jgi:hypothetical protein